MTSTLAPEQPTLVADRHHDGRRSFRPVAIALSTSVEAVSDALAHMDDDAVLAVPTGTPHQNFEVVVWCAAHDKPIINRFDRWPLASLLVLNRVGQPCSPTGDELMSGSDN